MPGAELPSLLFVSPTFPDSQGNGLAMRAGMFLEALAQRYRVTLLVIPVFGDRTPSSDELIRRFCADMVAVEPQIETGIWTRMGERLDHRPSLMQLMARQTRSCVAALGNRQFEAIHSFRLYTGPLALELARKASRSHRPRLFLDLDDVESSAHARLAELYRINGRADDAKIESLEASQFLSEERHMIPRFDRVYVCSQKDADRIRPIARDNVVIVPNALRFPVLRSESITSHPFSFLFVGTLDYYPNADAVSYFCLQVLPIIRAQTPGPLRVRIVGGGSADVVQSAEVRLLGYVEDIGREYAEADAVIVPLRSGGGTRIKVLEAFAHGRPVVSTSIGIEGIDATPDVDFLQGDTPTAFASQCLRLMSEPELGRALAAHATSLVADRYSQESINRLVASWR